MSEPLKGGFATFSSSSTPFNTVQNSASDGSSAKPGTLFGNIGGGVAGTTNAFGGFGSKSGGLFGGGTSSTPASGGLFSTFGSAPTVPNTTTNFNVAGNMGNATSSNSSGIGLFGVPKPAEQPAGSIGTGPANVGSFFSNNASNATSSSAQSAFFSSLPKPSEASSSGISSAQASGNLLGSNFFKKPDTPVPTATPITSSIAAPSLFGGLGSAFGAKKDDSAPKTDDKVTGSATPAGGLFGQPGNTGSKQDGNVNKDTPAAPAPAFGNLFGPPKPVSTENKDAPAASVSKDTVKKDASGGKYNNMTTSFPPFSLAGTSTNKGATGSSTAGPATSTATISVPLPSMLRGKTIEEIVNKWSSDLEVHVREFNKLAGEVAVWDRTLIENGNTIAALYQHVMLAEREQSDVEQSLTHTEQQQKEIGATLDVYEKSAKDIFDGQGGSLRALDVGPADAERDKNYTLAADLNTHLDDLSRSLTQMIESVNEVSDSSDGDVGTSKGEDPLQQIAQILSSHLDSLQWIDGAVREVEGKVHDVEKRMREAPIANGAGSGSGFTSATTRLRGFGTSR